MKKKIIISILILTVFLITGCGKKASLTCTYNNQSTTYEIDKGKIISAYTTTNGSKREATETELETMKTMYNSDTNEETVEAIKGVFSLVGATCK